MARTKITNTDEARSDLGSNRTKPEWREGRRSLPFHELGDDEFEVFSFFLVRKENPTDSVYYYGKTADGGRDLVLRKGTKTYVIQCKRYTEPVTLPDILSELAKLCVNIFFKHIPETPDEVHFYAVPRLTNPAANLLKDQASWRKVAPDALKAHLGQDPSPALLAFARDWWPGFEISSELSLTERVQKWPDLRDEFFGMKKVIDGSIDDVLKALREELPVVLRDALEVSTSTPPMLGVRPAPSPASIDHEVVTAAFGQASQPLLSWPTTVGQNQWINRDELAQLEARCVSEPSSVSLLLGPPGSGKSALLARLGHCFVAAGHPVLAIKADLLDPGVDSLGRLAEALYLQAPITDCVDALAGRGKVLVLVDQLDALADLVDLRSERLNVLLGLVKHLSGRQNVHVVCSCRAFEHGHDSRLRSIEADVVELALPSWEQVVEILRGRHIDASLWPQDLQTLLRTPQHLKIFLQRLRGTAEDRVFTSYQQLLEDLWRQRVTNDGLPGRSKLLMDMAELMAERETVWLPAARFDECQGLVQDLEAKGILTRSENGLSVGFQHQTLFEHARARAFARGHGSLAAYVLPRQDGLFLRPILWGSLNFLRGADPEAYHREMETLWRAELRKHVRHLLIDFLGQVSSPPPSELEHRWVIEYLQRPDYRNKVLAAIRDSNEWFTLLAPAYYSPILQLPAAEAWPMVAVLSSAWKNHRSRVLDLLRKHWLSDPARDHLTWRTFEQLTEWDDEAVDYVIWLLRRLDVNPSAVMFLASHIAVGTPDLAVRAVAEKLRMDLRKLEVEPDPAPPPLPSGVDEASRLLHGPTFRQKERFQRLLEDSQAWYDLPTLAEAAPQAYLDEVWPWFKRVAAYVSNEEERVIHAYRRDWSLATRLRDAGEYEQMYPVVGAIEVALQELARHDPVAFISLVDQDKANECLLVQRLLCRTLCELAATYPAACLQFLTEDPRRLVLGSSDDAHADTRALIAALVPHLTAEQAGSLEAAVLRWKYYRDNRPPAEAEVRFLMGKWERQHRLRLLTAFPTERLSPDTQTLVRTEREALPGYESAGVIRSWFGTVDSPMSAAQMALASDEDIFGLFTVLNDPVESHPRSLLLGGSVEASLAFADFAKAHPQRALRLIPQFQSGTQERPAVMAIEALADQEQLTDELFRLIADLDRRGFSSEDFRTYCGRALAKCARDGIGLPNAMCHLLERWLAGSWRIVNDRWGHDNSAGDSAEPRSILWQPDRGFALPSGTHDVLQALTRGYLRRRPPAADEWLAALEVHLTRPESANVWRALCRELKYLHLCDRSRAIELLQFLFRTYPSVRNSVHGAFLLTHAWSFLPPSATQEILVAMRDRGWNDGPQAFGELIGLRALSRPADQWSNAEVDRLLGATTNPSPRLSSMRVGLAFAAAELWCNSRCRLRATDVLVQLARVADARISHAIMHVFIAADVLYVDDPTRSLLDELLANPDVLNGTGDSFLVERLENLLPAEPDLVLTFCQTLVRLRSDELASMRTGFAANASHLTSIALTLQRLGGAYRAKGLDLFEALLDLGVSDAQATLQELDKRTRNVIPLARRRIGRRRTRQS